VRWVLEGGKFWLSVLTELRNRGPRDILICCCHGLSRMREHFRQAVHGAASTCRGPYSYSSTEIHDLQRKVSERRRDCAHVKH
jgi:hypothetical protein